MSDLKVAKKTLVDDLTCVLVKKKEIFTSTERGIKPLVDFINKKMDFTGFSVADKIVGLAAANLYIYLHIKKLYASVISIEALSLLRFHHIKVSYGQKTERIINRDKTDICPMEKSVLGINDYNQAVKVLVDKINSIKK